MKRILIADDSTFMRNLMKKILVENGCIIAGEAENGRIALEKYKELSPDIVTMDITMKEMTGLESLRKIIEHDNKAKVVMVSAMGQESFIKEALVSGAKGFLIKPFKEKTVISTISSI